VLLLAVLVDIILLPVHPAQLIPDQPRSPFFELLSCFAVNPLQLISRELPSIWVLIASSVHSLLEEERVASLDGDEQSVEDQEGKRRVSRPEGVEEGLNGGSSEREDLLKRTKEC